MTWPMKGHIDRLPSRPCPVWFPEFPFIGPATASTNIGAGKHAMSLAINKRFGLVVVATGTGGKSSSKH